MQAYAYMYYAYITYKIYIIYKYVIYDFFFKISFLSTYVNRTLISNEIKLKYFYNVRKI